MDELKVTEGLKELQLDIDVTKWEESEQAGHDLCGTYDFCEFCDKSLSYPCARADMAMAAADVPDEEEEEIVIEDEEPEEIVPDEDGYIKIARYRRSFTARLIRTPSVQPLYNEMKNYLVSFKDVEAGMTFKWEAFRLGKDLVAKFVVSNKSLYVYLALDPAKYVDSKYSFSNESDKKTHERTPMRLKVSSARSLKYAEELVRDMFDGKTKRTACEPQDFTFPDRSDSQMYAEGLLRKYYVKLKKRPQ